MPKSLFQILLLLGLVLGFSFSTKAQVDCYYGFRIHVRDDAGRSIEKAKHELVALSKEHKLPPAPDVECYVKDDIYFITRVGGWTLKGDFLLRISAIAFETYERKVNFPDCEFQSYELTLRPKGSTAQAQFERLAIRRGRVLDESGNPIRHANIRATNVDGRIYQTQTSDLGYYNLDLPIGVNTILISDPAIIDVVFENNQVDTYFSVVDVTVGLKSK